MRLGEAFLHEKGMSADYCRARARELLAQFNVTEPPVDVGALAGELGLTIRLVRRGQGFDGRLLRERMVIEVEESKSRTRQRFTIAHEMGHFVLNHNPGLCSVNDRSIADPTRTNERQANVFGSELLMPEPWVRERWRQLRRIPEMAAAFAVSEEAMTYRLDDLDLLGLPPAR